ncbi:HCP-like protein [Gigaspora margarita]|uniref:HCP-like protein n=1 Tax=Gigaspora margarita TaxID=4874 RepID=A0A8H3XI68_GIGMA|nr:HCP-like protein [Gigaspora margarita]
MYNNFVFKERRNFNKYSEIRLAIEKKNRNFLKNSYQINESITYWYAFYLYEGIGGFKDKDKASELYKVAADKGNASAQLRYAFAIKDEDIPTFIKYLDLSVKNGNSMVQCNLGYIYFYSKYNIQVDKKEGKKLLISAANKKDAEAIELCRKENINYLDY